MPLELIYTNIFNYQKNYFRDTIIYFQNPVFHCKNFAVKLISMRIKWLLCCIMFLSVTRISAQELINYQGVVISAATNEPLAGATLMKVNGKVTYTTNEFGQFNFQAENNELIVVSFVGFTEKEIKLKKNQPFLSITLSPLENVLEEAVVTGALGLKRSSKEFGASATVLNNENITQAKPVNTLSGLAGKVAGLRINTYDSKVDPQFQITLRGARSISRGSGIDGRGANEPIYVIDGTPVPSIGRLNPNDIANITVLKGASAAALYGSEGVNGAIMITTKQGKAGRSSVAFDHTTTFSNVYLLPPAQTEYGQGADGTYSPTIYESWGPRFDGTDKPFGNPLPNGEQVYLKYEAPSKDNRLDLFQTGLNVQNNISFSGGDVNSTYYFSAQHVHQTGIIPKDENNRINLRFNASRKIGKLNTSYNINYIHNKKSITPDGPWIGAYRYPANFDFDMIKDWENPLSPGNPLNYFIPDGSWLRNPFFQIDNIRTNTTQQIINGKVEFDYQITPWLNALYRVGLYSTSDETYNFTRKFEAPGTRNVPGLVTDGADAYRRLNSDFILTAKKQIKDFDLRLTVGQNARMDERKTLSVGVSNSGGSGQLLYPGVINIDSRTGNLAGSVGRTRYRSAGVYGEASVGYRDYLFVNFTGRNDWVSVLSKENRSYFYPGVNVSWVASDLIEGLKNSNTVDYAKLYASWNKTGNVTLSPYSLNLAYSTALGFPFGNIVGFLPSLTNPNPAIQPEFVTSYEAGTQWSFFNNRLNAEIAYVYSDSKGQILPANISTATGFSATNVNAGRLTNHIIEITLGADVVRNKNIQWNLTANFTHINNKMRELFGETESRNLFRQAYGVIGKAFPLLLVSDYERDPQGRVVVDGITGDPRVAAQNRELGSMVPPYQMGLSSMLKIKDFHIGLNFDARLGGWLYSEIVPNMYSTGTHPETAKYGREAFVWPNSVIEVTPGEYKENTTLKTSSGGKAFWSRQGEIQINTAAPSDFFKLRELNIGYQIPRKWLSNQRVVKSASINLIATNLFIIRHKDNKMGDPEFLYNNTDGYISFRQVPPFRTVGVNLNVNF
jgi:TonB-linked SusC/RagA family outer membrane protein